MRLTKIEKVDAYERKLQRKARPIITPLDGLESVKVMEKVYESSRMNKWIKVG